MLNKYILNQYISGLLNKTCPPCNTEQVYPYKSYGTMLIPVVHTHSTPSTPSYLPACLFSPFLFTPTSLIDLGLFCVLETSAILKINKFQNIVIETVANF